MIAYYFTFVAIAPLTYEFVIKGFIETTCVPTPPIIKFF